MDAHDISVAWRGNKLVKITWKPDQKYVDFDHWTPTHIGPESKLKINPRFIKANVTIEGMSSINFMFIHVNSAFGDSKLVVPFSNFFSTEDDFLRSFVRRFWNYVPNHLLPQLRVACLRLKFEKIRRCNVYTLTAISKRSKGCKANMKPISINSIRRKFQRKIRLTESKSAVHAYHPRILLKVKCASNPFYSRLPMLKK